MTDSSPIRLARRPVEAIVLPDEGGVLTHLRVDGRAVLASTPWHGQVRPGAAPAVSEAEWVGRWRGGWQLCFPSAGQADSNSASLQGFHGVASQAPWRVIEAGDDQVTLEWNDRDELRATRTWRLTDTGAIVETVARNDSGMPRPLVIAEHLILGADLLAPVIGSAAELAIAVPRGTALASLDYDGGPTGELLGWPGAPEHRWSVVDRATPPRVAALLDVTPAVIRVDGAHARASVSWHGLPHALVWEELAASSESPWNSSVIALGLEPTSAAHGMGTALPEGTITLEPGASLAWGVELSVEWLTALQPHKERS